MLEFTILQATKAELEIDKILTDIESRQPFVPHRRHREDGLSIRPMDMTNVLHGFDGLSDSSPSNWPFLLLSPLRFHRPSYVFTGPFSLPLSLLRNSHKTSAIPIMHGRNCWSYSSRNRQV